MLAERERRDFWAKEDAAATLRERDDDPLGIFESYFPEMRLIKVA